MIPRARFRMAALAAAAALLSVGVVVSLRPRQPHVPAAAPAPQPAAVVKPVEKPLVQENLSIGRGDTLATALQRAGMTEPEKSEWVAAIQNAFDVRLLRAGTSLAIVRADTGRIRSIEYAIDPDRRLMSTHDGASVTASVIEIPNTIRAVPVCGKLKGSLFESIEDIGERPELAIRIAEIFAWDLDFYTDPQEGDEFCIVIEKKEYSNGQPHTYGRILAASYKNVGTRHEAFLFGDHGRSAYYGRDGRSLKAAFLRSPIKFEARISSRFSHRRFHPVLRSYRAHLGTDYAVPTGTPVQAVAPGRVVFSGRQRGAGNLIRIEHASGYETYYMHLSRRFARQGERIEQGQRIGLVGSTGLSTGPHLDFRIRRNGVFLDFERLRSPKMVALDRKQMATFESTAKRLLHMMDQAASSSIAALH